MQHRLDTALRRFLYRQDPQRAIRVINPMGEMPALDHQGRMTSAFKVLDGQLTDRTFVAADRLTIADLSLCGCLFWPEEFDVGWEGYPAIGAWLQRIQAMPGWIHPYQLMPGHSLPKAN